MADLVPMVNIKGRDYRFYASGGTLFEINDAVAPYMAMLARNFPGEVNKALGSLGYHLRKTMREAMRAGGVGGSWPKHAGIKRLNRKIGDRAWRTRSANPHDGLFGHLYMAIGYRRNQANMRVQIGFLSRRSSHLAEKLQSGFETPITAKMRRLYSVRGLKLSKKRAVVTPARPLVGPVFQLTRHTYEPFIEARVLKYLNNARTFVKVA
ncbi:MAG: hypothetical protein KKF77_03445 [Proteobacteria bacterium]|nr:hypothetical protein [Pseudomonadota bacterium]